MTGAGNGASGTNGGCHIGWTWMTSVKHVHFTVVVLSPAKETASAPEQDSAAAHCASTCMKELVQITTLNNLDHFVLTGQL